MIYFFSSVWHRPAVKYALIAVLVSAVFALVTAVVPIKFSQRDPVYGYGSDSGTYWDLSTNLISFHKFLSSPGFGFDFLDMVNSYTEAMQRLPGYPLFLAGVRVATGAKTPNAWGIWLADFILVFCNAFFIISIFERDLFKNHVNKNWYWLVVLYLPFLLYGSGINTDFLSATLLAGAVYFAFSPGRWNILWAALFSAATVFTRGNILFFLVPFLALMIIYHRFSKAAWLRFGVGLLAILLVFAAWSYRNHKLSGYFTFTPFVGLQLQQNYIKKMVPFQDAANQYARWNSVQYRQELFESLSRQVSPYYAESKIDKQITSDTFSLLLSRPVLAAKTYVREVAQVFNNEYFLFNVIRSNTSLIARGAAGALILAFYTLPGLLFFAGLFWVLWRKKWTKYAIVTVSAACYALITAAILGDFARYILPIGFVIIFWSAAFLRKFVLKAKFENQI